jgi:hypothetical protein
VGGKMRAHHIDRRADAVGTEVVFCNPNGIVSILVHYMYSFHGTLIDLFKVAAPSRPAKKLQNPDFHKLPLSPH